MNYTRALERIHKKLMDNPEVAERIVAAEKLAQEELDRQESTKDDGYKVIMALPKSLKDDKHLNVCLAKRNFSAYDNDKKTYIAWTSLNTSQGGLNHGHYDCTVEEASKVLFDSMYDEIKKEIEWMDKPRVELANLVKTYCNLPISNSNVVDVGDWRIRDDYEKKSWDAIETTGRQLLTKGDFKLYKKNNDGLYIRVGKCEDGMFELESSQVALEALNEIVSFDTEFDLTKAIIDAAKDFPEPIQVHLDSPLLVTDDELAAAIEKAIEKHADRNGDIEIYADYNDRMDKQTAIDILDTKYPGDSLYEKVYEWFEDEAIRITDEIKDAAMESLMEKHPGIENTNWYDFEGNDRARDLVSDMVNIKYPIEHFEEQEFPVNIYLDSGNLNTDFGSDVLPRHPEYNMYYRSGQNKQEEITLSEAMENIPDTSAILWLAKQQGYTKEQLAKALVSDEKIGDKFLDSCKQEIENTSYSSNTLVFLTTMTMKQLIDMNEAMKDPLKDGSITLPKGTECGLFDYSNGSGSVLEIETNKDIKIPVDNIFTCMPDGFRRYDVDEVYGLNGSVWKNEPVSLETGNREITCANFTDILKRNFEPNEIYYARKPKEGESKKYKPLDYELLFLHEANMMTQMSETERAKYKDYLEKNGVKDNNRIEFLQELVTGEKRLIPVSVLMENSIDAEKGVDVKKALDNEKKRQEALAAEKKGQEIKSPEISIPPRTMPLRSRSDDFGRGL